MPRTSGNSALLEKQRKVFNKMLTINQEVSIIITTMLASIVIGHIAAYLA